MPPCSSSLHDANTKLMFVRFTATLGGLATNEIIQKTADRLETIHSEGVHVCKNNLTVIMVTGNTIPGLINEWPNEGDLIS